MIDRIKKTKAGSIAVAAMLLLVLAALLALPAQAEAPNFCNTVILTRFAGDEADIYNVNDNWNKLQQMYNGRVIDGYDCSSKAFIAAVSRDKVRVDNFFPQAGTDTVAVYTLSKAQSGYSSDSEMITEVCAAISNGTISFPADGHALSADGSGWLDCFTIIAQGDSNDNRNDMIYPHKGIDTGNSFSWGGNTYHIGAYNVIDTANLLLAEGAAGLLTMQQGVVSHEMMHVLGFPDLYRYSGNGSPVGMWDIMSSASSLQAYPLAYMRMKQGYVSLDTISEPGTYTLDAVGVKDGKCGVIIDTPLSDSEKILAEFRVTGDRTKYEFDSGLLDLRGDTLLLYRVDTSYDTNATGSNFIYVYRRGTESATDALENVNVTGGIAKNDELKTYGSTDLAAPCTDDTLFYSDGSNSGVKITNVVMDGTKVTFDVEMADYSAMDMWNTYGGELTDTAYGGTQIVSDGTTTYIAYDTMPQDTSSVHVMASTGGAWTEIGTPMVGCSVVKLAMNGNTPVLCVLNKSYKIDYYKLDGSTWTKFWTCPDEDYSGVDLCEKDGELYTYYIKGGTQMRVFNLGTTQECMAGLTGSLLANPSLCVYDGVWYALSCDVFASGDARKAKVFRYENNAWGQDTQLEVPGANTMQLCAGADGLYALAVSADNGVFAAKKDGLWTQEDIDLKNIGNSALCNGADGILFTYVDNASYNACAKLRTDEGWTDYGSKIALSAEYLDVCAAGDNVYAAVSLQGSGKIAVKMKGFTAPPTEPQRTLTGISVATAPNKTSYYVGDTFDATGLVISAQYSDETTENITSGYTVTPTTMTADMTYVTIGYGGKTTQCNVTVAQKPTPTPKPTATPTPKPTATKRPTATATPTPKPTATKRPSATATPTPKPTATKSPTATTAPTPKPTSTKRPTVTTAPTPKPTATKRPAATTAPTPKPTATKRPAATTAPTAKPTTTQRPTATAAPKPTTPPAATETGPAGFVERLYSTLLARKSDPAGKADWVNQLTSGANDGATVASGFVLSRELKDKKLGNEEFVNRMYRTFLNREADDAGRAEWVKLLDEGVSYGYILHGFAESKEFTGICESFGIKRGNFASAEPRDSNAGLTAFVSRFYSIILERAGDEGGLNNWCSAIIEGRNTPKEVAYGFVFSQEFTSKNYSDEDFVEYMYLAFLGRQSEPAGKADWVNQLKTGKTREQVFDGFADSIEFHGIVESFGLK